jgi:hypothetical protein
MLAYLFWHVPFAEIDPSDYETALLSFHRHLGAAPPSGLESSATYRISEVPWLNGRTGYEDWCFVTSSAVLDTLNKAAVKPERWEVHASISSKTDFGHGGLYYHLHGDELPITGSHVVWLKRPRGIRYEQPLQDIISGSTGFLSCWRKQMVLGPGDEFAIVGDASLEVAVPQGWQTLAVERTFLGPTQRSGDLK